MLRSLHDIKGLQRRMGLFVVRMRGLATRARVPRFLQVEPTNDCNIGCRRCPNKNRERERGYMSFPFFCRIVDEAADIGVRRIFLYLRGEPLLHHRIGDMVRHLKSRDLAVTLATNGILMDRTKVTEFMDAGMTDDDYVHLPAAGQPARIRVQTAKLPSPETTGSNIADLLEYRAARMRSGGEAGTRAEMWRGRAEADAGGMMNATLPYPLSPDDDCPTRIWQTRCQGAAGDPAQRPGGAGRCRQPWERMTVLWNGDVALCTADVDGTYVLGSLRRQSIADIWNGEQFSTIRGMHKRSEFKTLPICAVCGR